MLLARREEARAAGGVYGFIVDERQWLVNLDYARVEVDRFSGIVDERSGIDVVVSVDARDLERVLRGSHATAPSLRVVSGDRDALTHLRRFLAGVR